LGEKTTVLVREPPGGGGSTIYVRKVRKRGREKIVNRGEVGNSNIEKGKKD